MPPAPLVPEARVTLTNTDTNARRVVNTNGVGEYNASSLPIGTYLIEVEEAGFSDPATFRRGADHGEHAQCGPDGATGEPVPDRDDLRRGATSAGPER